MRRGGVVLLGLVSALSVLVGLGSAVSPTLDASGRAGGALGAAAVAAGAAWGAGRLGGRAGAAVGAGVLLALLAVPAAVVAFADLVLTPVSGAQTASGWARGVAAAAITSGLLWLAARAFGWGARR